MQRQIDKLDKDTYRVRKAEGRPKHGQTSFTILGVGAIAWFLLMVAIAIPEWRANWIGVLGYPYKRSWGLFSVSGMETKPHHAAMSDVCRYFSQLAVAGVCASPICLWYRTKCQSYMDMAWVNYSTGFMLILALILHTLVLVWTSRMTPRMIRWAATWWVGLVIVHISVMTFWIFMSGDVFTTLDSVSVYPEPDFSFAFFIYCLSVMCICVCALMGITLMKMWPESSSSEESTDSDEDDSGSGSDGAPQAQYGGPGQAPPPGGMMGAPPPGYGQPPPGYGPPGQGFDPMMGGPPQQGWDPNMGGGPPQQGWDPNMGGGPPQQGWDPSMGGGPPQQGWDPNMGGGPPQQGWDPNMGGGPPQQGWDPNMGEPPQGYDPNMGPPQQGWGPQGGAAF